MCRQELIVGVTSLSDQLTSSTSSVLCPIVEVMALRDGKVMFVTQSMAIVVVVVNIVQHIDVNVLRVDLDRVAVLEEPSIAASHVRSPVTTGSGSRAILEMIRMMMAMMVVIMMPFGMMQMMMMVISGRGGAKILVVVNININNNDIVQMLINTVTIGTDNAMVVVSGSWSSAPAAYSAQDAARNRSRSDDLRMAQLQGTTASSQEPLGSGAHSGRLSLVDLLYVGGFPHFCRCGIFFVWTVMCVIYSTGTVLHYW